MSLGLLETKLGELEPSLREDLNVVKHEMRQAWDQFGKNDWFPDYGIGHSERVISMIEQILAPVLPDDSRPGVDSAILLSNALRAQPLTAHELYVLLAACYLHDVGLLYMLLREPKLDSLDVDGYKDIDQYHPQVSYDVIIKTAKGVEMGERTPLGLRNNEYLRSIALVVKAHSAETFEDAVEELQKQRIDSGEEKFRGDLLAALLMMGDQLDMTRRRARFPNVAMCNAASLLYNHTFSYIRDVQVLQGSAPLTRRIKIWFELPQHPSKEGRYTIEIRSWVIGRLKLHCNKTQRIFDERADGLKWEDKVEEVVDPLQPPAGMPSEAIALLREMQHDQRTVDRTDLKEKLKNLLEPTQGGIVVIHWPEYGDQELLMDWFEALCRRYDKVTPIRLTLRSGRSTDREGLMERIALGLNQEYFDDFWREQERLDGEAKTWSARLPELVKVFLDRFQAVCAELKPVIILENVHLLEKEEKKWLKSKILEPIQGMEVARRPVMVLLLSDQDKGFTGISSDKNRYILQPFTVDDVREHFQRVLGYSDDDALTEAQRLVKKTGGVPSLVLGEVDYKWMEHTQIWKMLELT
jgi:hypothetical protein